MFHLFHSFYRSALFLLHARFASIHAALFYLIRFKVNMRNCGRHVTKSPIQSGVGINARAHTSRGPLSDRETSLIERSEKSIGHERRITRHRKSGSSNSRQSYRDGFFLRSPDDRFVHPMILSKYYIKKKCGMKQIVHIILA